MSSQYELIHNTDWKILIVLDACRPDYFSRYFPLYFRGVYRVVETAGCPTLNWVKKTFPDKYDFIYISGNPHIVGSSRVKDFALRKFGYFAGDHFKEVVDVWDFGWKPINGVETVDPVAVSSQVYQKYLVYRDRIIAHYLQPHPPYVGRKVINIYELEEGEEYDLPAIKQAYSENLDFVLSEVYNLLRMMVEYGYIDLDKDPVVITSDHGEYLGEDGKIGHNYDDDFLRRVPWLEIGTILF